MGIYSTKTVKGGKVTEIEMDIFMLNEIPDAMDEMGWEVAPKLMRHWFETKPAFGFKNDEIKNQFMKEDATLIPKERVNDSIVKMEWAMNYQPVRRGFYSLKSKWASPRGIDLLRSRLKNSERIGYSDSAIELDTYAQVNVKSIGSMADTINDYYGAIGKANLKLAVRGYVDKIDSKDVFITEMLGFYIKDSYDFMTVGEPLGVWSRDGVLDKVKTVIFYGFYDKNLWKDLVTGGYSKYVPVSNDDFRAWQNKHNEGGDFIVFSDVLWTPPQPEHRIIYL
ncbi:DUF6402 family protein [Xenorhabdus sp. IM139775]|uniref:DUF6402 family protein n=1 Tax=Xenorhabdus sp. IM139775 TaxID=3025876 RepID=UPI0023592077|nr:DUF6402 family protein [Xenorhabdus sp. IM139775]MDC9595157.1 DUF6402 family protein [Xenorhabdus sp. IM139775]